MCYPKPGPRCTPHALRLLKHRKAVVDGATTDLTRHIARVSYEEARSEFYATKGGLRYLRAKVNEANECGDARDQSYWERQLSQSEQLRAIRMAHLKSLKDAPEPKETHQEEEKVAKPSKFLGITLNKDESLA